ncbi:hypothetical protein PY365_14675 [Roseiarcaceae bacterium H3SJ34-1]|uniref:hypothetical protein n=1 Tax=Terripilifer ovatus TaxID=3032367 RepID=UPI003AB98FCE|nr:hypothetical protein [Roseiarcaceae bacterium H3SJ34-1]
MMKFFTPEQGELIEIKSVEPHDNGLMIHGRIMGAMPMKAVLRPEQLRAGFKLLTVPLVFRLIAMLFTRSKAQG